MEFVNPSILWFLPSTLIPLIIHLFNFRRYRKVIFSDIRFLKSIQQESVSSRRLKDWIILALRMLAIACLVMVFAGPYLPEKKSVFHSANHSAIIYVDNSYSMGLAGEEGNLLEQAKTMAASDIESLGDNAEFLVISNDKKNINWMSMQEAKNFIDGIHMSSARLEINQLHSFCVNAFNKRNGNKFLFVHTDFQQTGESFNVLTRDSLFKTYQMPVKPLSARNIFIDTAWLNSPILKSGRPVTFSVKVMMSGGKEPEQVSVKMYANDLQKGVGNIQVSDGHPGILNFTYTPDLNEWQKISFVLEDHPMVFDDRMDMVCRVSLGNNIVAIAENTLTPAIRKVYQVDNDYKILEMRKNEIDYRAFEKADLIILDGLNEVSSGLEAEILRYMNEGGQVFVIPSIDGNIASINSLLNKCAIPIYERTTTEILRTEPISKNDPFFKDVFVRMPENPDLPLVSKHYTFNMGHATKGRPLLKLSNTDPLVWIGKVGKGKLFVSAVNLNDEFSNLTDNALFVPFMLKMAMGAGKSDPLMYESGRDNMIVLPETFKSIPVVELYDKSEAFMYEVIQRNGRPVIIAGAELNKGGIFSIQDKENKSVTAYAAFFNNRAESILKYALPDGNQQNGVYESSMQLKSDLIEAINGRRLWRLFLIASILFLGLEMLLLRWKTR